MASHLDPYKDRIEAALDAGYSKSEIARGLKVSRSTLRSFIDSWDVDRHQHHDPEGLRHILGKVADRAS